MKVTRGRQIRPRTELLPGTDTGSDQAEDADQAYAHGLDHGWTHANYCEAYAVGELLNAPDRSEVFGDSACYFDGWHEGVRLHEAGRWQDGSPREEDGE